MDIIKIKEIKKEGNSVVLYSDVNFNIVEKCSKWLQSCSENDDDASSQFSSSESTTDCTDSSETVSDIKSDILVHHLEDINHKGIYKNITVSRSKKVHIGPAAYYNGPVYVINKDLDERTECFITEEQQQKETEPSNRLQIVSRRSWLAQPPINPHILLKEPAKYVIICHTATEESFSIPESMYLIRLIQCFHIDGRNWDDIAYNFLIDSDGRVYEGRGWNVVGSHTYHYNFNSIGIAFVGTFLKHLPPSQSLLEAQKLIQQGVETGAIAENYSLVGHCQLSSTKSPGNKLFDEIKNWDRWDSSINYDN